LAASSHVSEQSASPSGPEQGLPACVEQLPDAQVSAPLQNRPSSQTEPSGSFALHASALSSQTSEQSASPSGPLHGLPPCSVQPPLKHELVPLQNTPSSHAEPF